MTKQQIVERLLDLVTQGRASVHDLLKFDATGKISAELATLIGLPVPPLREWFQPLRVELHIDSMPAGEKAEVPATVKRESVHAEEPYVETEWDLF